jgi:acetyltransferase-like isoleucine patch superfamily enzyme/TfoX/Sxy family transcriptional regulator of competence genes
VDASQHPAAGVARSPATPGSPADGGPTTAPGADVDPRATLGAGTRVWHLAQVREGAVVGADCVVGRGAYLGPGVRVGDRCKIQNHALVYEPAVLEEGAFVGPAAVLTNDLHPRAVNPDGTLKSADDWHAVGVTVRAGASVGARAVCVAPVVVGRWALVAAGAVVTRDVPDHALVAGVPARRVGWVGRTGEQLVADGPGRWRCPATGDAYVETDAGLRPATPADDAGPARPRGPPRARSRPPDRAAGTGAAADDLAARVRTLLVAAGAADAGEPAPVSDRPMFGGVSFFVGDAMVASVRGSGDLLVRVASDRHDELAARPGAAAARMGGRTMGPGWLTVGAAALATDEVLAGWLALAREAAPGRRVRPARARP